MFPIASQDDINNSIHVGDSDLSVAVYIGSKCRAFNTQDDVGDGIDISNIDTAVAVHVTLKYA